MDLNRQKRTETDRNGLKQSELDKNKQKRTEILKRTEVDMVGRGTTEEGREKKHCMRWYDIAVPRISQFIDWSRGAVVKIYK